VHGNVVSLLGEVNAVAGGQDSLLNTHYERIAIESKGRIVKMKAEGYAERIERGEGERREALKKRGAT
jgi:hypothetical protein